MPAHSWNFLSRLRRHAFNWRSEAAVPRLEEAVREILDVARDDPAVAADGAVRFFEKVSPAVEMVDTSSGVLGSVIDEAIVDFAALIGDAPVEPELRLAWLRRLWKAIGRDEIGLLDRLADQWGRLCGTAAVASAWADAHLPAVHAAAARGDRHVDFSEAIACLSSLHASGRHDEVLDLLGLREWHLWRCRQWGVKALVALGRDDDAIRYAERSRRFHAPPKAVALVCEAVLLRQGRVDDAYCRYGLEANRGATPLATFRALVRKYHHETPERILRDLVMAAPGSEGKWFAAARREGLLALAAELANASPVEPRTLLRAARDHLPSEPAFTLEVALAALRWMRAGHGQEPRDEMAVLARDTVVAAGRSTGLDDLEIQAVLATTVTIEGPRDLSFLLHAPLPAARPAGSRTAPRRATRRAPRP